MSKIKMNNILPGRYENLSNEDYHAAQGLNTSKLKTMIPCPGLVEWAKACPENQDKKKTLDIGNALHTMVLEPNLFDSLYAVEPVVNKRTNAGKAEIAEFLAENADKAIISASEYKMLRLMQGSVSAHPAARELLKNQVGTETSIFAEDEDGELMKIRIDLESKINGETFIVDLKTIDKISNIPKAIHERGYNLQAIFYREVYKMHTGEYPSHFLFVFVSKSVSLGRYETRVGELCQADIDSGQEKYDRLILKFKKCKKNDYWPGIEVFEHYRWAK